MTTIVTSIVAPQRRVFYVGLSLLLWLIAVVGFWPTYFGPLAGGRLAQPPIIHLHAVVFTGWLALFSLQALLAAARRVRWHVLVGRIGIVYGAVLIGVGLVTGVVRSAALPLGGEAEGLLLAAFSDMVVFAGFFAAAIRFRRQPQLHKRLMIVAATMLLIAATSRMPFLPAPPEGLPLFLAIWWSPIVLAIGYDVWNRRGVHFVYLIGLAVFVLRIGSMPLSATPAWGAVTRWVTGAGM